MKKLGIGTLVWRVCLVGALLYACAWSALYLPIGH